MLAGRVLIGWFFLCHVVQFLDSRRGLRQQTLSRFLAPGAVVTGLGGAVTFSSISAMQVPSGGSTRNITVSVVWQVVGQSTVRPRARQSVSAAPAGLEMTYEMTVVQQNGTWYVKAIGPSDQQPGGQ